MAESTDIEMSDISKILETPQSMPLRALTCDSMDSGYLSLTPHSFSTPSTTRRPSSKRHYWLRSERWQNRPKSKLTTLINASEGQQELQTSQNSLQSTLDPSERNLWEESSECRYNFRKGLREYRSRARRCNKRPSAITIPVLSPPLSPVSDGDPLGSIQGLQAVPQSTPVTKSYVGPTSGPGQLLGPVPKIEITFSPKTRKDMSPMGHLQGFSAERQEFSKMKLSDFGSEIRPKKLDFNQRWGRVREGKEIDILCLLGERSNHLEIVSKILGFLRAEDLCAVSMVSRAWRRICGKDVMANMRRITHVCVRQSTKENLRVRSCVEGLKKVKEGGIHESPKSRFTRGYLVSVQNFLGVPKRGGPPHSPPVSPSKIKFHSFVKASRSLAPTDRLFPCPKCTFACHVNNERNVGTCTRKGCTAEFCTYCLSTPHTGSCKTPLLATPTKRKTPPLIVGSKQSKRNLRRL